MSDDLGHPPKFESLDQTLKRVVKHWKVTQDKSKRAEKSLSTDDKR